MNEPLSILLIAHCSDCDAELEIQKRTHIFTGKHDVEIEVTPCATCLRNAEDLLTCESCTKPATVHACRAHAG